MNMASSSTVAVAARQREQSDQLVAKKSAAVYFRAAMRVLHEYCKREKRNPAKELRLRTQHGIRACERYIAGDRVGGFGVAVDLLFTPEGPDHFEAWRAERKALGLPVPDWADDFLAFIKVTNAMKAQEQNRKQAEDLRRRNNFKKG